MGKPVVIGLSIFLVVAAVAAVCVTVSLKNASDNKTAQVATTNKAVQSICATTDFSKTCEDTVGPAAGTTTNVNDIVKIAFNVTMARIDAAIKNTTFLQQAAKDPKTADAYKNCEELLVFSIDELQKSFDRIGTFELSNIELYLNDLKTWLSSVITYQDTCLDGFENTTTDAAEKMRQLLKVSSELSQNALAMIDEVSKSLPKVTGKSSRRLLSSDGILLPSWVDAGRRKLLQTLNYDTLVPNVVVSKAGPVKTINDALKMIPPKNQKMFVIKIEAGFYQEYVTMTKAMGPIALIGAGIGKTIVSGNKNKVDGVATWLTATMAADGPSFFMRGITVENTAGHAKHQAVAFRSKSDMSIIHQCEFNAFQDTLYPQANRQLYYDCVIRGTVDFIFGDALAVFQKCKMIIRKPGENQACMVTAQGRIVKRENTGFVIQQCNISAEPDFLSSKVPITAFLGRPWKQYSRTIIMQSTIDKSIVPLGWSEWQGNFALDTLEYAEYQNTGDGAGLDGRVKWPGYKKFGPQDAARYTASTFMVADSWVKPTGIPYISGL